VASVIEICNAALARLAVARITSLEDASRAAELCTDLYPICRDKVLEAARPRFASVRRTVAADAAAPDWGYTNRFALPATCVAVLEAWEGDLPLEDWQAEGGYVLANAVGPLRLRCVDQVADPGRFSPGFVDALVTYLAHRLCVPLTENRSLATDLWTEYQVALKASKAADNLQGSGRTTTSSWLARSRG
jgi:hypothetical protein